MKQEDTQLPLGRHLHVASRLYFISLSAKLKGADIDKYYSVLTCIDQERELISQQEVGRRLMIDKASMVKIVDYLAKKGFVERRVNLLDRRSYHLCLTAKAREMLPGIYKTMGMLNQEAFKGFSPAQVQLFNEMLCRICNTLQKEEIAAETIEISKKKKSKKV
ncbi:MAG: MarR family transcriptional regulator [Bacteroidia bacterium]|nr:MarR family transcriptional regulator [Bacteroidia bacterium]